MAEILKDSFSGTPRTPAKDCVLCTPEERRLLGTPRLGRRQSPSAFPNWIVDGIGGHCYTMIQVRVIERISSLQNRQAWKYLIGVFAVFWVVLAIMFIIAGFPFYIITLSLSIMLVLSAAIVALAWAYQNNW